MLIYNIYIYITSWRLNAIVNYNSQTLTACKRCPRIHMTETLPVKRDTFACIHNQKEVCTFQKKSYLLLQFRWMSSKVIRYKE